MLDKFLVKLFQCQLLTEPDLLSLIQQAKDSLTKQPNVVSLSSPLVICGDIHGQFYDLLELFKVSGLPPATKLLFLGDYVDRGYHSVEVLSLLLCLHLKHPDHVMLLRGNHESRQITQVYGFYDECIKKYNGLIWRAFVDLFDVLPLAALVDDLYFCCHGGLSPSFTTVDEIRALDRRKEVPHSGAMCDLLWSDPDEKPGWGNSARGAGFTFGPDMTKAFNKVNGTKCILRAHQLMMGGYCYHHQEECITVFSAPNYCYRCNNLASVMNLDRERKEILCFDQAKKKTEKSSVPDFFY